MNTHSHIFKTPQNADKTCSGGDGGSKLAKLQEKHDVLAKQHAELRSELHLSPNTGAVSVSETLLDKYYQQETKHHISNLKKYNDLKDLSMNLIQIIATQKHQTMKNVMSEMGIDDD